MSRVCSAIALERQVRCAQREVALRQRVYPGLVSRGRMAQRTADQELATMQAIVETLQGLLEDTQLPLFTSTPQGA